MADIRITNHEALPIHIRGGQPELTLKKPTQEVQNGLPIRDPSRQKNEEKENRISLEELTKSLMKPNEIKRLLYLAIPFTRHLIAELDQNKGNFFDKLG